MKKEIDCIIIGYNNINLISQLNKLKKMGFHSGAYRDFSFNYIIENDKPLFVSDIYNKYYKSEEEAPLNIFDTFSNTIAYLGTFLKKNNFTFDFIHSFTDEKIKLKNLLQNNKVNSIAITTTYYVSSDPIEEIISFIKGINSYIKIIIGGPYISTQIRSHIDPQITNYLFKALKADIYINSSQGELTLIKCIKAIKGNHDFDAIPNIYYRNGNGIIENELQEENNILSDNLVDWQLFSNTINEYVNVRASISCPFNCAFCGFPEHAGKYQSLLFEQIKNELGSLELISTLKGIKFVDDTFNVPKDRFKEIVTKFIKHKYKFKWISNFRCQFADEEIIELMKESGCELVFLGIESGSNEILKNMNKSAKIEQYYKGIELLKKYGIVTFGSLIVGFPGETYQTYNESIKFLKNSGLDFYRASVWYCERITPIWRNKEKYNIVGESYEWEHSTMNSKEAFNLLENMFYEVTDPVWVPLQDFDIDSIWHLIHRGRTLDEIKDFLKCFNQTVAGRIKEETKNFIKCDMQKMKLFNSEFCLEKKQFATGTSIEFDI